MLPEVEEGIPKNRATYHIASSQDIEPGMRQEYKEAKKLITYNTKEARSCCGKRQILSGCDKDSHVHVNHKHGRIERQSEGGGDEEEGIQWIWMFTRNTH